MPKKGVTIEIPADLYEGIRQSKDASSFPKVEDYIEYILRSTIKQSRGQDLDDSGKVEERLKRLGYI